MSNFSNTDIAENYRDRAQRYQVAGRYEQALELLQKALRIDPDNPLYRFESAELYFEMKRFKLCLVELEQIL